ncbi:ROK family protein (plasmid) [Lachnospiraceae bacterium C1.1]|nr:ROK family protein [Lachnospiraceae bacterium C1.1]
MAKNNTSRIVRYILNSGGASKAQIASDLNLSMPTVLAGLKGLMDEEIIIEDGSYESTGGRKAKNNIVNPNLRYSVGVDITGSHIGLVIIDMTGQLVSNKRIRMKFEPTIAYCQEWARTVNGFIDDSAIDKSKILGVGVAIAGIVDNSSRMLLRSHALNVTNLSLKNLENSISLPIYFENDANAALMAESTSDTENLMYISLSNTVGGSIYLNGKIYRGMGQKAGEFGHMLLHPGGRKCYCGKIGCSDAYLSALNLRLNDEMTLEEFMELLKNGDKDCEKVWDEYLDDLALLITNLRASFDSEIIIGGYVGYYIEDYLMELSKKIIAYSTFDMDAGFLRPSIKKREASASGAAGYFINEYIDNIS